MNYRMSHWAIVGLGLMGASCAGGGRAAPGAALAVPESKTQSAVVETPLVPCPGAEELAELVVETARIPPQDTPRLIQCREGRFPAPGWVVIADSDTLEHVAVIDAQTRGALAMRTEIRSSNTSETGNQTLILELAEVADLDGDRVDEIVQLWRAATEDMATQTLLVERVEAGNLATALNRQIGWISLPVDESCVASVAVAEPDPDGKRRILITVDASGRGLESDATASSQGLEPARCRGAVYELSGSELVDVTPQETAAEDAEPYDFEDSTAPAVHPKHPNGQADEEDAEETREPDEYDIED